MATILMTWELGAGLGHVTRLLPIVRALRRRGHTVYLALRNVSVAEQVFGGTGARYLQAPIKQGKPANPVWPPCTYPHILHNIGFGEVTELKAMTDAWQNLYKLVQPDLVVFDHSPTALLAARGYRAERVVLGSGFFCPPDCYPFPSIRPETKTDPEQLRRDEHRVRENMNEVLLSRGEPTMERVADLYRDVNVQLLTTFKELDHFGPRPGTSYWGAWPTYSGAQPKWPNVPGKKIFAYLKPIACLPHLLKTLNRLRLPTIVYGSWVNGEVRDQYESKSLRLESQPLDLKRVGADCDLAILNGTHGTTAALLLAGTPILQLPIHLEQRLMADNVVRLGASLLASRDNSTQVETQLNRMLDSETFRHAAHRFADHYAGLSPQREIAGMIEQINTLLPRRRKVKSPPPPNMLSS